MILLALLLAAADPAPPLAGFYHSHQIEIGAAIELEEDGKFDYALDYGAVSEVAEGSWTTDGRTVYLTSTRMEGAFKQPAFTREPLQVDGSTLILKRYDTIIRFDREGALPSPPNRNTKL
jgi:hypothetical protein